MSLFKHETKEEKFIKKQMKILEDKTNRTICLAEYGGSLELCKVAFEQTIRSETINARERRQQHIGDSMQKKMIYDAVIGLLAVEEADFELRSLHNIQTLDEAKGQINDVLRKMYRINHYLSINGKQVKNSLNMEFDDTNAVVDFSSRAELVDEKFVEMLIQGATVEECLQKVNRAAGFRVSPAPVSIIGEDTGGSGMPDFSVPTGEDYDKEADINILKGNKK